MNGNSCCIYPHCEGSSQRKPIIPKQLKLYLPSLRGEFTAETGLQKEKSKLYLPSLRGEFTARL